MMKEKATHIVETIERQKRSGFSFTICIIGFKSSQGVAPPTFQLYSTSP